VSGEKASLEEVRSDTGALEKKIQSVKAERAYHLLGKRCSWTEQQHKLARAIVPPEEIAFVGDDDEAGDLEEMLCAHDVLDLLQPPPKERKPAAKTPAVPMGTCDQMSAEDRGYISPEDYMETPAHIRRSPEFQRRLAESRKFWPVTFDHRELVRLEDDGTTKAPRGSRGRG